MKKKSTKVILSFFIFIFLAINIDCTSFVYAAESNTFKQNNASYSTMMKQDILCLMLAYPEYIQDIQQTSDERVYVIMKSGKKLLYDDKKQKTPDEKLSNPDLQDMMEQPYPLSSVSKLMDKNYDPGRSRIYPLLNEVYGSSKGSVESNLGRVTVGSRAFQFNKNNKAAEELKAVMAELNQILQKNPGINKFAFPCSGTFNYRVISGTNRLSPHSYGIAIDLARDKRDYWQWASPEEGEKRLRSYPKELVEVFERHNFVWGGKWSHFDILHFEYRPEIILKAKYFGMNQDIKNTWHSGIDIEEPYTKACIDKIEKVLR